MTQYEMTEMLSKRLNVTMTEAKDALEANDWNMLDAAVLLEQQNASETSSKEDSSKENSSRKTKGCGFWATIRNLIDKGTQNTFEVRRNGESILEIPLLVLVVLMLVSFGSCTILLVIGLFAGCSYKIGGKEISKGQAKSGNETVA